MQRAPKENFRDKSWKLALLIPRAERATEVARQALADGRPACILMPSNLVHYTAQETDGTFNPHIAASIAGAAKLTFMTPCMTWVCIGTTMERNDVFNAETRTTPPGPMAAAGAAVGTLENWITEQAASMESEQSLIDSTSV